VEEDPRELRRRFADWSFIESLPPRLRKALKYYIETGDICRATRLAGLEPENFRELLREANVLVVV